MDPDRRAESFPWWTPLVMMAAAPFVLWIGFTVGQQMLGVGAASQESVRTSLSASQSEGDGEKPLKIPANLAKWGTPDLALVLTGQTFGYLGPCGCSSPQYGGLVRRYNVIKAMERAGWKVAGVDLGEIYPPKADLPEQAQLRFTTTLKALSHMNYQDYGLGETELNMPLFTGLALSKQLDLKNPRPLSLDLKGGQALQQLGVQSYDIITDPAAAKTVNLGVASMVGPSVAGKFKGNALVDFFPNPAMLPVLLNAYQKNKVDFAILLVHGTNQEAQDIAKMANKLRVANPALPNIDLIIYSSPEDTPPAQLRLIPGTNTRETFMGHKGKEIGVLGLFRKAGGGFKVEYDLVSLGPDYDTPEKEKAKHPIMNLLQEYADAVKKQDFLAAFAPLRGPHPTQRALAQAVPPVAAHYVGSDACKACHKIAYNKWFKSKHSEAFEALVDPFKKNPPFGRQFDPDCVVCHTVGFKFDTGYYDPPAGGNAKAHNLKLENVGCESCHGPGSMHVAQPKNKAFYPLINPIKNIANNPPAALKLDFFCQTCHDIENDVHWGQKKPFEKSWARIEHNGPANEPEVEEKK